MTGEVVEIPSIKWAAQRRLELDKGTQDALADYLRQRWPSNTSKMTARAFGLSLDRARHAVNNAASLTTYDQIKKAGGWQVIFAVEAAVIGQTVDQFLIELKASHEQNGARLAALVGDGRPLSSPRGYDPGGLDFSEGDRWEPDRSRVGEG